jgi:cytosine/adenosine deaminase-related metal-dependent hydrolase
LEGTGEFVDPPLLYHRKDGGCSPVDADAMELSLPLDAPWTIRARWVFPVDAPPVPDGRVTIHADRIVSVATTGPADVDVGNAAILPGFVNAHTHLDLGMLHGRCPPTADFTAWLRCVIAGRQSATAERVQQAIADGIAACLRGGTTLVGDISAGGASWTHLATAPLRSVVFYELLGLPRERADIAWAQAHAWLATRMPAPVMHRCRAALSPHAPYSVRRDLYRRSIESPGIDVPWATHLAESRAELELLRYHAGPFVAFLRELNVWAPDGLVANPVEVIEMLRSVPNALLVHCNYLPPDVPLRRNQTIVYCPRTHAAFGHPPHPLPALIDRGVRVALGTDSLASNPDLDILAEARFVHARYPELPGDTLLRMLTLDAATALGWGNETGSLTPGKFADMVVLPLEDGDTIDPHMLLWQSRLAVAKVIVNGQPVLLH